MYVYSMVIVTFAVLKRKLCREISPSLMLAENSLHHI
jgi:hypothetical protein